MAMNNDNVNELLEGLNKKQKRMKEVDEQLSSIDIEIEYYKGEIKAQMAEMTKDINMKECKLKEKRRTVAELKTAFEKSIFFTIFCLVFPYLHLIFFSIFTANYIFIHIFLTAYSYT